MDGSDHYLTIVKCPECGERDVTITAEGNVMLKLSK